MVNHEVVHEGEITDGYTAECVACRVETQDALSELGKELNEAKSLPSIVSDYIAQNYDPDEQAVVLERANDLRATNSMIFHGDPEQIITFLPTLLGNPKISKLANQVNQLDSRISAEQNREKHLTGVIQLEEIATSDPELKGLRGRALLAALKTHSVVTERPHLQARLTEIEAKLDALVSLAADPAEAAILETIISQSSIRLGADAPASIFADVLARTDAAPELSEATKANVHKLFHIPTVETAGDLQTVLDNGYGTDASGNTLPITADQKLRVFPNTYLYEDPSGDRLFEINVPGNRQYKVRFDRQTSETDLYDSSLTVQIIGLMAQMNLVGAIWQRGWTLQTGGVIDLHYDDVIKAKRVYSLMSGGDAGFDGRLASQSDQSGLLHRFQSFPSKGDAALGDNDPTQTLADYQELSIVDETGAINWAQFEKAAHYMQEVAARGGQPDFKDLKAYLTNGAVSG